MRILVTGAFAQARALAERFPEVTFDTWPDERAAVPNPEIYDGVICNALLSFHDAAAFSRLQFVQLTAAGYDRVPLDQLKARGVRVYNARDAYAAPMAEATVWGLLTLYRNGKAFLASAQRHAWEKQRGLLELSGKRVCVMGCGNYGRACAGLFAAFGCRVIGVNRTGEDMEGFDEIYAFDSLKQAVADADIVISALPLTEQTEDILNADLFAACKRGCVLVNLSRGRIVRQADMIAALTGGQLGGAVLDVFETEPLDENSPLWDMDNVVLTPHNAYAGDGVAERLLAVVSRNLEGEMDRA